MSDFYMRGLKINPCRLLLDLEFHDKSWLPCGSPFSFIVVIGPFMKHLALIVVQETVVFEKHSSWHAIKIQMNKPMKIFLQEISMA